MQRCKYKGKCYKKWTNWLKTFSLTRHGMFFGSLIKEGYLGWYFDFWKNKKIQDGRHFFRKIKGKHYKEDFEKWPQLLSLNISFFFLAVYIECWYFRKKNYTKKNKNKMAARECRLLNLLCDLFMYLFMYICQHYEETIIPRNLTFCIDDPSVV